MVDYPGCAIGIDVDPYCGARGTIPTHPIPSEDPSAGSNPDRTIGSYANVAGIPVHLLPIAIHPLVNLVLVVHNPGNPVRSHIDAHSGPVYPLPA